MRALTVRQPWADAIVHDGRKRIENRTWALPARHHGTHILIHAGTTYAAVGRLTIIDITGIDPHGTWPDTTGAIIGAATLAGCHAATGDCCTPWGQPEVYHWTLADVTALPEPVPCKGRLGLWTPDADVLTAVQQQLTPTLTETPA